MVSGNLEESLRREIEGYVEGRLSSLKQEITKLQSQVNEAIAGLLDRQSEIQMDGSLANSILEHLRAAHEQGIERAAAESSRAKASSDMAIVKAALDEISAQQSQAAVLKTLINRAASFAPRVAFFVVKGEQATGWRARGFEGSVGDKAIQQISLSLSSDTVISDAANSKQTWSGGAGSHADEHQLLNRLGEEPPQRLVAVPLVVRNRSVAVVYADSAGLDSDSINLEALETLTRVAAMAVELLSVSRASQKTAAESAYTPEREYEQVAEPVSEGSSDAETIRAEETGPAVKPVSATAPTVSAEASAPEPAPEYPTPRRRYGTDTELPISVSGEEERRLHSDARRFARLLVSEIKLYNEQKVAEGRSGSDLYDRLKEYIDRSREMYDKRVKPDVAARYDYFHQELVDTLAQGDEAKLGANYPGATVMA